jgi:hypothetical protein
MKKNVFAGNTASQYDSSMVLKEASDFYGQALRTIDTRSVTGYYSHFRAEYDVSNNPTLVQYFRGTKAYRTHITCIPALSLAGKYFVTHSAPDNQLYVIWYKVSGIGSAPVVSGAKYIEISVNSSDSAEVVAAITKLTLDSLYSQIFQPIVRNGSSLEILTNGLGVVDPSVDINTGFTITGTDGEQETVSQIEITYDGTDPIYLGETLKGYSYDIYSGKFVKNLDVELSIPPGTSLGITDQDGDNLEINNDGSINVNVVSTGQVLKSYFFETAPVATGITATVCSYTPVDDVYLQKVEFSGTNIASFELYVNDVITDKKLTYFSGNMEGVFNFNQGLNIPAGEEIKVLVYHNRPDPGIFNARIQILESGT